MLAALLAFLTLACFLPAYLANEVPWFRIDAAAAVLLATLVYISARIALLIRSGERRIISLTFWLFAYVWGALSAFLQVGADVFPWNRAHSDQEQLLASLLLFASLLIYDAGSALAAWRTRRRAVPTALVFSLRWSFVYGLVAVASTAVAIAAVGGPSVLLQSRGDASAQLWQQVGADVASRNLLEAVLRSAPFVACLTLLFALSRRWREMTPRARLLMSAVLAVITPLAFISNYPNAIPRGWLGTVALSFLFVLVPWRRWTLPAITAALIIGFVFVFPYSDRNRVRASEAQADAAQHTYFNPAWPLMVKGDYDVFVQLVNGLIFVREQDYLYGRNLAGSVLFWVPRRWWHDKPINTGHLLGLYMHNPVINLSAPLWLEAYLAFGLAGTLGIMGLYGYFCGSIEQRYVAQLRLGLTSGVLQIFVPFWAGYQVFFLRGPLMNSVAYSSFAILIFAVLARWQSVPFARKPAADPASA